MRTKKPRTFRLRLIRRSIRASRPDRQLSADDEIAIARMGGVGQEIRLQFLDCLYICIYNIQMDYEWAESKREANLEKHGLDFIDAYLVLESEYVMVVDSPRGGQLRQQAFAYVFDALAVLTVAFVPGEARCRIISFRPARRTERRTYYEWLENHYDEQR